VSGAETAAARIPVVHGGIALDVPAHWADQSTLLFVAPPPPALPTAHAVAGLAETVTVRFVQTAGRTGEQVIADELAGIADVVSDLQTVASAPFDGPLGAGQRVEVGYALDGLGVIQVLVAVPVGDVTVLAVAIATAARRDVALPLLNAILATLRPAPL
jgi:hypothetical protein